MTRSYPSPTKESRIATLSPSPVRLQRKCDCGQHTVGGEECEECKTKQMTLQRHSDGPAVPMIAPPIVHEVLQSPGQPLDAQTRSFFEPRFGYDFSQVRVHTDQRSADSARAVNALAYTVGKDIAFASGQYEMNSSPGRQILAHELAHFVQQGAPGASARGEICVGESDSLYERQADVVAGEIGAAGARRANLGRTPLTLMRLTPAEFREKLGATKDEKAGIAALFKDKTFLSLWEYLRNCPATPKKDLGPLSLRVTPGLKIGSAERYGGYSPVSRTLEINPTKPEHKDNPAELVDTITHELIHAVDDLQSECKKAGGKDAPLAGGATTSSPSLADVKGTADEDKFLKEPGPGASNPCEEFIDINRAAQQMIIEIIRHNIKEAKVGKPTITFLNEILRRDPKALAEYKKCRDTACAKKDEDAKTKAVGDCSRDIMAKFMPKELKPS